MKQFRATATTGEEFTIHAEDRTTAYRTAEKLFGEDLQTFAQIPYEFTFSNVKYHLHTYWTRLCAYWA